MIGHGPKKASHEIIRTNQNIIRGITAYHISLYPPSPPHIPAVLRRACGGGGKRSFDRQMSSEKVMPDGYKQAGVHIASIGGRAG